MVPGRFSGSQGVLGVPEKSRRLEGVLGVPEGPGVPGAPGNLSFRDWVPLFQHASFDD